jgi:hypothetical protein
MTMKICTINHDLDVEPVIIHLRSAQPVEARKPSTTHAKATYTNLKILDNTYEDMLSSDGGCESASEGPSALTCSWPASSPTTSQLKHSKQVTSPSSPRSTEHLLQTRLPLSPLTSTHLTISHCRVHTEHVGSWQIAHAM